MPKFYIAEVTDNNDTDQEGKVKIKIKAFHENFKPSDLPWAKPLESGTGGGSDQGKSSIPEKNSFVWVFFEDEENFRHPFYFGDLSLKGINPHKYFEDNVKSKITGFSGSYPDVKFQYYKNGICIGVSTSSSAKEIFIYHPGGNGGYFYIKTDGTYDIKDGNGNTLKTKDNFIELNGDGKRLVTWEDLNTALQTMLGTINTTFASRMAGGSSNPGITLNLEPAKTTKLKTS